MRSRKKSLGFISTVVLLFNIMAIVALLLSYLAPIVKPQTFWPIAFLGIGYPVILTVNILFILFWLIKKPKLALLSLISIIVGWGALSKNIGVGRAASPHPDDDTSAIRIMSYNVQMFQGLKEDAAHRREETVAIIDSVSPDVLCVQEFYTRAKGLSDMKQLFERKLDLQYSYFIPAAENEYDAYGIAIFSKYPIIDSGILNVNKHERIVNRIVYADINKSGKNFRVYNVHLQSIGFDQQDYDYIKQGPGASQADVESTKRIGRRLKRAYLKRNEQVDILYSHTQTVSIPYVVAGDFNDTPLSYSVNRLSSGMTNAFVEKGEGLGVTYNGAFPNFQIDYILASQEFKVKNFQIVPHKLSDHFPIWSDLQL